MDFCMKKFKTIIIEMTHHKISPSFIGELVVEEDSAYNTRATTNVVLDANNRAEISKKSSYKVPKINTVSFGKESFRWLDHTSEIHCQKRRKR